LCIRDGTLDGKFNAKYYNVQGRSFTRSCGSIHIHTHTHTRTRAGIHAHIHPYIYTHAVARQLPVNTWLRVQMSQARARLVHCVLGHPILSGHANTATAAAAAAVTATTIWGYITVVLSVTTAHAKCDFQKTKQPQRLLARIIYNTSNISRSNKVRCSSTGCSFRLRNIGRA